jgi:hypothetical protein
MIQDNRQITVTIAVAWAISLPVILVVVWVF